MANWRLIIDLRDVARKFHAEEIRWQEYRDAIVKGVRESGWATIAGDPLSLAVLVDELSTVDMVEHADILLEEIYDLADEDLVWLAIWF